MKVWIIPSFALVGGFVLTAAASPDPVSIDLNAIVGGGAGAAAIYIVYYVGKLILDRTLPSRSDARANITILLQGLQSMVEVLQKEKEADAKRLADRQARIDSLEEESDKNYSYKAQLQSEIIEFKAAVARRDRHIKQLVHVLNQLGATVMGLESDTLEITLPISEVPKISGASPAA